MESETRKVQIRDLIEWDRRNQLIIKPDFQRRKVWSVNAQSYFLDTIIRGLPTHKFFIREYIEKSRTARDVVDGQQRIHTILEYVHGNITIKKIHNLDYGNLTFFELPNNVKRKFLSYVLSIEMLYKATDADVLQLFARLNTYMVRLNSQEMRNAKYSGLFKTLVYDLSAKSVNFYRQYKILTKRSVLRMGEAELISELIISMMDGIQDKKKSINKFYNDYEDTFNDYQLYYKRYWEILDLIDNNFGLTIKNTSFRRRILFYSLFLTIYDIKYGLPKQNGPYNISKHFFQADEELKRISNILRNPSHFPEHGDFIESCARQTDNRIPRQTRHNFILNGLLHELR